MKKVLIALTICLLTAGVIAQASDLIIESKTQSYSEAENKLKFEGDVKVSIDDLKVVGDKADVNVNEDQQLDTATFYDKPYAFEVKKNKKREVKANILKVSLITKVVRAEGDTQSTVFDGKTPIVVVNSDVQEYDTKTGVMTATGAVTILYKELETFSDKAKIKTDKNGDLRDIELLGNARIKQTNNESFADRFEYNAVTKTLVGTGNTTSNATMEDGNKLVLKSSRQEYIQDKNIFNASGNCRVWYQDYYAVGPKITVYPNKAGKPNDIYFTGRSSITQGVRTIFADKIKMTLKPKDFHADGNTRTVIKNVGSGDNDDSNMGLGL
ncbi:MAG: LptA/OstA family protein [Candidatus Gastranaerophilaceae bacterium]